jgi:hypothetical protein
VNASLISSLTGNSDRDSSILPSGKAVLSLALLWQIF